MPLSIDSLPVKQNVSPKMNKAYYLACQSQIAAKGFYNQFELSRKGKKGGRATGEELNLLRAMLVFAGAGLDGVIKETIRSCLHDLAKRDTQILKSLRKKLLDRKWKADDNNEMLLSLILEDDPQKAAINLCIDDLSGSSLQSKEGIIKVFSLLGLSLTDKGILDKLKLAFNVRNKIIHEFDCTENELAQGQPCQQVRSKEDFVDYATVLLNTTSSFFNVSVVSDNGRRG